MSATAGQRPTVLHYCQHSVGLGHLVRSTAVAAALASRYRVVFVCGGLIPDGYRPPAGVELVTLPAIDSADGLGGGLRCLVPGLSLEQARLHRTRLLVDLVSDLEPAAIVVELFPLGRRQFAGELLPMLECARRLPRRPLVVCSVRDVLVTGKARQQERDNQAAERLNAYFDAVVVHADPRLARLEETFRPTVPVHPPVHYSGYVVPHAARPAAVRRHPLEVVVSAGGGRSGGPLLHAAAQAQRRFLAPRGITTRLVTGPFLPAAEADALHTQAAGCPGLILARTVPDLGVLLAGAAVSVSQCGYNTALDVLRAGVPALVVPFDAGGETEQAERARRLAATGALRVLPATRLSAADLGAEVLDLLGTVPAAVRVDLDGAARTAALVDQLVLGPELVAG